MNAPARLNVATVANDGASARPADTPAPGTNTSKTIKTT
jgi:hypothetical protein